MNQLPLRLKRYFFPLSHVEANPAYKPDGHNEFDLETRLTSHFDPKSGIFAAQLIVTLGDNEDENLESPYFFQVAAYAGFEPAEGTEIDVLDPDTMRELLATEGFKILAGAIREHLASLTARGPWGEYILPVLRLRIATE